MLGQREFIQTLEFNPASYLAFFLVVEPSPRLLGFYYSDGTLEVFKVREAYQLSTQYLGVEQKISKLELSGATFGCIIRRSATTSAMIANAYFPQNVYPSITTRLSRSLARNIQ